MRILIFGKNGQVARCLGEEARPYEVLALGSADCDLSEGGVGVAAIRRVNPDIVINAAAFTSVDDAEITTDLAMRLNTHAPAELAAAAQDAGAHFIHLSTDYVFDGAAPDLYDEDAPTSPLNIYGKSKREGELAVLDAASGAVVIRTSWVFSEYGANFVKTMLRLAETRAELSVVDDQVGGPTPAREIARAVLSIAAKRHRGAQGEGIYHYQGAPAVSWAAFAEKIFALAEKNVVVRRIPTNEFPTPAKRPLRTVLNCARIERDFGISQPDWRVGLREVLRTLKNA